MFKKINKKYIKYIIFTIIGYAIFLRFYNLGVQSFWIDEGFSSYVSNEIFKNGINFMKPEYFLHNISQFISFNIFGVSDFSARLPSIIFSALNIWVIYLIGINLFKDKKVAVLSVLIFSFLTWEIIWARQARFYSLLQLLFSINLYLNISIIKDIFNKKNFYKYLNIFIILSYIGILFHPFLYSNLVIFIVSFFYIFFVKFSYVKKTLKDYKFNKKYLLTIIILLIIFTTEGIKYYNNINTVGISTSTRLSKEFIKNYINNYNTHLFLELGILYFFFIISLFIFAVKRKFLELIFIGFSFFFIFYIISQKGFLFHTRYVLILYPLIIIGASYSIIYFYKLLKNSYLKIIYVIIVFLFIFITTKLTFLPQKEYFIDYTSPQPNFKKAYNIIPNNSEIISGFPMMCEWYYGNKGECIYHLPVDYTGSPEGIKKTLKRGKDNYTKLPYLLNLEYLEENKTYYFVLDNLSYRMTINKEILNTILEKGEIIFDNGKIYNNIKVIKYIYK